MLEDLFWDTFFGTPFWGGLFGDTSLGMPFHWCLFWDASLGMSFWGHLLWYTFLGTLLGSSRTGVSLILFFTNIYVIANLIYLLSFQVDFIAVLWVLQTLLDGGVKNEPPSRPPFALLLKEPSIRTQNPLLKKSNTFLTVSIWKKKWSESGSVTGKNFYIIADGVICFSFRYGFYKNLWRLFFLTEIPLTSYICLLMPTGKKSCQNATFQVRIENKDRKGIPLKQPTRKANGFTHRFSKYFY